LYEELLELLISFSHGEWALRNINGLQLLLENATGSQISNRKYFSQLSERKNTFLNITLPNIDKIILLADESDFDKSFVESIKRELELIKVELNNIDGLSEKSMNQTGIKIGLLKSHLTELRNKVFAHFSCDPAETIRKVTEILGDELTSENIELKRVKKYDGRYNALIRGFELAEVLDNCITNAISAMKNSEQKKLKVTLFRTAPKIIIEIEDSGKGIAGEEWNKIFEQGFSKRGSTGFGMYLSLKTLKKYGGRISIKESRINEGTTVSIELNEGKTV
jgi:signal transduction histidine kinase